MNPALRAAAALGFAGLVWGTSDVASKVALDTVSPMMLAFLRVCLAAAICWCFARRRRLPSLLSGRLALLGLVGVAGALLLQNAGLERTDAANGSMLQGAAPILVVIGAAAFLRESPGFSRWTGVSIALVGVAAITLSSSGTLTVGISSNGDVLVLGSAVCFATFVIVGRPVFVAFGTLPVLAAAYTWAFVFMAPVASIELAKNGMDLPGFDTLGLILFLGLACSAAAHALWGYALRHIDASQAAVFDNVIPIVGVVSAAVFLQERPSSWELLGGGLVIVGAVLASRSRAGEAADPRSIAGSTTVLPVAGRSSGLRRPLKRDWVRAG